MRVIQNIIDLIRHKKKLVLVDTAPRPTPKTQFRPEYSARNIGLYKTWEDQETIRYIGEQLSEYCYGG